MPIRILIVARPAAGGMAAHLRALCTHLASDGYRITVAAPKDKWIPVEATHVPLAIADRLAPHRDLVSVCHLRRLMRSCRYDLVHVHGLKAALLTALVGKGRNTPPLIVTLHNALPAPGRRWREMILRRVLTAPETVIVVSEAQARDIRRRQLIDPERVMTVPNGIVLPSLSFDSRNRGTLRSALNVGPDDCLILTVARLLTSKGIADLIEAAYLLRELPSLRFFVVGSGPDLSEFTARTAALGLTERLIFLGYRDDVPDLLQAADLFVLPSHSEGTPLSILEAMAARCAVVATNVGGIPEIVEDGQTGCLVPARRPAELARAIARLALDPDRRIKMGEAGHRRVETRFTQDQMLTKITSLYQSLLTRQTRLPSRSNST
ncbi:MAG: glycosyltransferase family 4 protein [Firmicutes bacterium]|nr:glycosyltransferase family 4 protein [Bacillota bacterium]